MARASIALQPSASPAEVDVFALLSHEIRTPLNGVLGMAGLLASTPLDATQAAYLQTLRDCGEHLLGLVNDVLDLAKLQSSHVELEPSRVDLERLLQGVCELLSPRAHAQGLEIGWAADANAPALRTDDGRLRQILFNLAGNAVKMSRTGGVLVTANVIESLGGNRTRVLFCVDDTGPGVDPADAARIFQPFVQAKAGEQVGGAGLGLAVVKRLADVFGGEVGVEPAPDGGARFWFQAVFETAEPRRAAKKTSGALQDVTVAIRAPCAVLHRAARLQLQACGAREAQAGEAADAILLDFSAALGPPAPDAPPTLVMLAPEDRGAIAQLRAQGYAGYLIKPLRRVSLAEQVRAAIGADPTAGREQPEATHVDEREAVEGARRGLRVLLAEDNPINALLAAAVLKRSGCTVDRASTGAEAVEAAATGGFDLVLMDMRMPGMDGPAAARAIRAGGLTTPILALTANAFDDDRRACLEAGMDDFLTKPLDPHALEAALARLFPVTR